jgi:hypothetical protein
MWIVSVFLSWIYIWFNKLQNTSHKSKRESLVLSLNFPQIMFLSTSCRLIWRNLYLIYKDECLFVSYTNPHFWTDRNQTLHTSPPWSGRDHRVCMGPQYFTFPTFSTYFVGSGCRFMLSRWLPAPHCFATTLYLWCGACLYDIHGGLCNENTEKWTECVCVKTETWWDRKEVTNELHLQLHCICTNDNVKSI